MCKSLHSTISSDEKDINNNLEYSVMDQQLDFCGEPMTFLKPNDTDQDENINDASPSETVFSADIFTVAYLTKGNGSARKGGDEYGIGAQAAHCTAIPWADLIRHASRWCYSPSSSSTSVKVNFAPMATVTTLSPLLANTGRAYLEHLDRDYFSLQGENRLTYLAELAVQHRNSLQLTVREKFHLWALYHLLNDEHNKALATLSQLLETSPGDALALSLALDIANNIGDGNTAMRTAMSVAAYWNERGKRTVASRPVIQGHPIGLSLIGLGLAMSGRSSHVAEDFAERAQKSDGQIVGGIGSEGAAWGCSGISSLALAHIYNTEGRTSEGISLTSGFDGAQKFNRCGFLFFDSILGGYGCKFVLDKDGSVADRIALRIYDENFSRLLSYSGYDDRNEGPVLMHAPEKKINLVTKSATSTVSSMFHRIFGGGLTNDKHENEKDDEKVIELNEFKSIEDILSWLPPTTQILTEATLLLVRLTVNGIIDGNDNRWQEIRAAWEKTKSYHEKYMMRQEGNSELFSTSPLIRAASIIALGEVLYSKKDGSPNNSNLNSLEEGSYYLGKALQATSSSNYDQQYWKKVVALFSTSRSGWTRIKVEKGDESTTVVSPLTSIKQDNGDYGLQYRDYLENAICYAALMSDDRECLSVARSICSEAVVLRSSCPEAWLRYSSILEKLGDYTAAADAKAASFSLGFGEGRNNDPR